MKKLFQNILALATLDLGPIKDLPRLDVWTYLITIEHLYKIKTDIANFKDVEIEIPSTITVQVQIRSSHAPFDIDLQKAALDELQDLELDSPRMIYKQILKRPFRKLPPGKTE